MKLGQTDGLTTKWTESKPFSQILSFKNHKFCKFQYHLDLESTSTDNHLVPGIVALVVIITIIVGVVAYTSRKCYMDLKAERKNNFVLKRNQFFQQHPSRVSSVAPTYHNNLRQTVTSIDNETNIFQPWYNCDKQVRRYRLKIDKEVHFWQDLICFKIIPIVNVKLKTKIKHVQFIGENRNFTIIIETLAYFPVLRRHLRKT